MLRQRHRKEASEGGGMTVNDRRKWISSMQFPYGQFGFKLWKKQESDICCPSSDEGVSLHLFDGCHCAICHFYWSFFFYPEGMGIKSASRVISHPPLVSFKPATVIHERSPHPTSHCLVTQTQVRIRMKDKKGLNDNRKWPLFCMLDYIFFLLCFLVRFPFFLNFLKRILVKAKFKRFDDDGRGND